MRLLSVARARGWGKSPVPGKKSAHMLEKASCVLKISLHTCMWQSAEQQVLRARWRMCALGWNLHFF